MHIEMHIEMTNRTYFLPNDHCQKFFASVWSMRIPAKVRISFSCCKKSVKIGTWSGKSQEISLLVTRGNTDAPRMLFFNLLFSVIFRIVPEINVLEEHFLWHYPQGQVITSKSFTTCKIFQCTWGQCHRTTTGCNSRCFTPDIYIKCRYVLCSVIRTFIW